MTQGKVGFYASFPAIYKEKFFRLLIHNYFCAISEVFRCVAGFIRLLIGPRVYHQTAVNVIDSLQYPQLNK